MHEAPNNTPLASFEAKWNAARPELALALKFVAPPIRRARMVFACLAHELEHAAFGVREAQPAVVKLQWWADEFAHAARSQARHPLTQALLEQTHLAVIPLTHWLDVVRGALAQRDRDPAVDTEALLAAYAELYGPLAAIEAMLFPSIDATAAARARSLSRALRETAGLSVTLRDGRVPVPLDVLARHRLARGDLAQTCDRQASALREWLAWLAEECQRAGRASVSPGVLAQAGLGADTWRAQTAARAADPITTLDMLFRRLSLRTVWAAWRAGRRSPA
ncbi:MAG: squalene/phytoene synthase family protein [Rhodanobacter sp.]|jgi:phytoene synthase|nr:squalene/phytoene synthase family protein [Rhodanobacter sp.]